MNESIYNQLIKSSKVTESDEWDALYDNLPVVIVPKIDFLQEALNKLDKVGGYGYIAIFRKDLFLFNTKLLSKRCGMVDENGKLLKPQRVPKNKILILIKYISNLNLILKSLKPIILSIPVNIKTVQK